MRNENLSAHLTYPDHARIKGGVTIEYGARVEISNEIIKYRLPVTNLFIKFRGVLSCDHGL